MLFCRLPSPDGVRHAAKGMMSGATVTAGADRDLPAAIGTIIATDFAYGDMPAWTAGRKVVRLRNDGGQFHELDLVEIQAGKTVGDVLAWFKEPDGAPPMRSLGGAAIGPGREATASLELRRGSTYAFLCAIPDFLGDRVPHLLKGMVSAAFTPEG